ncbi:uncharacterized protein UTRI_01563_B [Ustilago trichophora]|uniref:Glycosyltransferase family 69 protein n=1 Tax=Ustilago trichophora TaxID=86804 RepID=A0A5C3E731_9BASI|nr:uncharacterized protein UTRI_01563_B [Ustilago trichophora]
MSLCPRAAAQALQSPPELQQSEYKHDAAYFDQADYPQYTLHPSNRFGPDQEPLLEAQPSPSYSTAHSATPAKSRLVRYLTWLLPASLPRSSSVDVSTSSASKSRKAWLPVLLITNLAITVVAFIAACIHFNTFTTLFLYLALLIVAFPILSLSLLLVNSTSYNYKLQLPDWSPTSTPLSEQSFSSFSGLFNRSSDNETPPLAPARPPTRRHRACRPARLESLARSAQYLFAVIWFLAIVEWLFFQPILPSSMGSTGDEMVSFIHSSSSVNPATEQPMKVFIASNLYNSEEILPDYTTSLKRLISYLGPENVFVSIYESHSTDQTKPMLAQLHQDLAQMNVSRRILSDDRDIRKGKYISSVHDRIDFLAKVRNIAMQPLVDSAYAADKFTHVLWVNDLIFTPQDALNLLRTNNAHYDQACAMDFIGNGFYDTWVVRDAQGETLKRQWPYFKREQDIEAMREGRPFEVNSCWNGITAFDAKWFYPSNASAASSSAGNRDDGDGLLQLPLQFRSSTTCLSSECQLISYDIHRALYPARPTILINPAVKVAYNHKHYFLFNSLIPSPILRTWRIVWRDWIGYRLLGWATEGRRWANECKPKQKFWAPAPSTEL